MKKIFKLLLIVSIFFSFINSSFAEEKYSAVVKVVSYENLYWKYIKKIWWWSASMINDKWYMVTNSHVVDDGEWNVSDHFNICLTYNDNKKPKCDYTASLVGRSKDLDVAILKIDSKDIFWNDVEYSSIEYLNIDYNYDIDSKKDIYAIWYPWIWSETITKTKWIVSWTIEYNGYKYIKSDTLISGWNSGWALISMDNKLIWIPTFLVWWNYDSSIGYSISFKEVKEFLEKSLLINIDNNDDLSNFIKNKIKIDEINETNKITDSLITISFDEKYEVKNYIENKWFDIEPILNSKYLVSGLKVWIMNIPKITSEEDYLYYLEKQWFYYKWYHKLKTKNIWWIDFYYPIVIWDSTGWESSKYLFYFSKIWDDKLIIISIHKPLTNDSETNKIVNKNVDSLLSWIKLNKSTISEIDFGFNTSHPKIDIKGIQWLTLNEVEWVNFLYFWNLYDFFFMQLQELSVNEGKGKTIEDIFKNETLDIDDDYKSMIIYKWHKWFIYCDNYDYRTIDNKWATVKQNKCFIQIYEGLFGTNDKEYKISWMLLSDKNKIEDNLEKVIKFLDNNVSLNELWNWQTKLVNIYKNIVALDFKDIEYQSDNYKSALKKLIKYKLLKNSKKFNPDKPTKWKEFIVYYFESMYNYKFNRVYIDEGWEYSNLFKNNYLLIDWKSVSMFSVFMDMKIPLDEYVDIEKTEVFIDHMKLILSWEKIINFSEKWHNKYKELLSDSVFEKVKQSIDNFNNITYWNEEVDIEELLWTYRTDEYIQTNKVFYINTLNQIITTPIYETDKYNYSSKNNLRKNKNQYKKICELNEWTNCYNILTKSLMIDLLLPKINFTLFDESLKNKKKSVLH